MATTAESGEKLLSQFPPASYEDWRKVVEAELKGAPFDKKMLSASYEGIAIKPIYRREDVSHLPHVESFPGFAPFVRGATASGFIKEPWHISQEIAVSSPTEFNHVARNSLSRGLNALNMVLDHATRNGHDPDWAQPDEVGLGGLSISTVGDLNRALEGVDLDKTRLFIRSGPSGLAIASLLVALAHKRKKTTVNLRGCVEMDPLGVLSHEGRLPQSLESAYREMSALTRWASENAPHLQTICVHSRSWHEAGANAVQELAFILATGVEYLRKLHALGVEVNVAAPRTRFAITVGVNFFTEVAKLRAFRMLWSRAVAAAGGNDEAQKLSLHVRTARWSKTVYDPHTNLLRGTVEALAGVLGGCSSMQVGAFDEVIRQPDDFSVRIARNTQLVLQKECLLEHVIDPLGGSWYVENLTAELAERAWAMFQEVEKLGGMEAALRADFPQKLTRTSNSEKQKAVARRRDSVVGINQYANPAEKPLEVPKTDSAPFHKRRVQQIISHRTSLEDQENSAVLQRLANIIGANGSALVDACVKAAEAGATLGEMTRAVRISDSPCSPVSPVELIRRTVPLEQMRAATERQAQKLGEPAKVFLCNMGSLKEFKARADFSAGFFAVAGYSADIPGGFKTPAEAAEAFGKSGARIAVICSTDDNYPALVPPLAQALRAQRADALVVLAGYPQDQIEAHKQSGVAEFIHIRADLLETFSRIHAQLGILP